MGRKDEQRRAEARRRDLLKMLVAIAIEVENCWTMSSDVRPGSDYPALNLAKQSRRYVDAQWGKIHAWMLKCAALVGGIDAYRKSGAGFFETSRGKLDLIVAETGARVPEQCGYGARLAVATTVFSVLVADYMAVKPDHRQPVAYFERTLRAFADHACPMEDSLNYAANVVYYAVRDEVLEHPDWSVYDNAPMTAMTAWAEAHAETKLGQAYARLRQRLRDEGVRWNGNH